MRRRSAQHDGESEPETARPVARLCTNYLPNRSRKKNYGARETLAVLAYVAAGRPFRIDEMLDRWPAGWPALSSARLREALRYLEADGYSTQDKDTGAWAPVAAPRRRAAEAGARFAFLLDDLALGLSQPARHLLALLRGRDRGRTVTWHDSIKHLAKLLGASRSTASNAMKELEAKGAVVRGESTYRVRSGHRLGTWRVENHASGPKGIIKGSLGKTVDDAGRTVDDAAETVDDTISSSVQEFQQDHALRVLPAVAETAAPVGADDPIQNLENRARAARENWDEWLGLQTNTARDLMSAHRGDAAAIRRALTSIGVHVAENTTNRHEVRAIACRRQTLAEELARRRVDPVALIELAVERSTRHQAGGQGPASVSPMLLCHLHERYEDYKRRSAGHVDLRPSPLPMSVEVEPTDLVSKPFGIPDALSQAQRGCIARAEAIVASVVEVLHARDIGGQLAAKGVADYVKEAETDALLDELSTAGWQRDRGSVESLVGRLVDRGVPRATIERAARAARPACAGATASATVRDRATGC